MSSLKKVGLIECGTTENSFTAVSPSIPKDLSVIKAFMFNKSTKRSLYHHFPEVEFTADYQQILNDEKIELVLISSASTEHRSMIGEALKAKKAVQLV